MRVSTRAVGRSAPKELVFRRAGRRAWVARGPGVVTRGTEVWQETTVVTARPCSPQRPFLRSAVASPLASLGLLAARSALGRLSEHRLSLSAQSAPSLRRRPPPALPAASGGTDSAEKG